MSSEMENVRECIKNSSPSSKVYVGCDSRQMGKVTLYVTVVVVHHDGNKGAKVFPFYDRVPRINSTRYRLIQEAYYSTYKALELQDVIGERYLSVHLDYHPEDKHRSNAVVKEAIGFVLGQGLEYELKPNAHAATSAADWLGRHGVQFN